MTGFTRSEAELASTPTPITQLDVAARGARPATEVRSLLKSTASGTTVWSVHDERGDGGGAAELPDTVTQLRMVAPAGWDAGASDAVGRDACPHLCGGDEVGGHRAVGELRSGRRSPGWWRPSRPRTARCRSPGRRRRPAVATRPGAPTPVPVRLGAPSCTIESWTGRSSSEGEAVERSGVRVRAADRVGVVLAGPSEPSVSRLEAP